MFQFALNSILVALVSLLQTTDILYINGIKPNLALVFLLIVGMYELKWSRRIILILISMLFLKISPYPDFAIVAFGSLVALGMGIINYLPWRSWINGILALAVIMIVQIILVSYPLEYALLEFIYNLIFGALLVLIISLRKIND